MGVFRRPGEAACPTAGAANRIRDDTSPAMKKKLANGYRAFGHVSLDSDTQESITSMFAAGRVMTLPLMGGVSVSPQQGELAPCAPTSAPVSLACGAVERFEQFRFKLGLGLALFHLAA